VKSIYFFVVIFLFFIACNSNKAIINNEFIQDNVNFFESDNSVNDSIDNNSLESFNLIEEENDLSDNDFFESFKSIEEEDFYDDNDSFSDDNDVIRNVYYSNPVSGKMTNSGSKEKPWASLQMIFKSSKVFKAGDRIVFENGNHGNVFITGKHSDYVTIEAQDDANPVIQSIVVENASYWYFKNLIFNSIGSKNSNGVNTFSYLFYSKSSSSFLKIEHCKFYSIKDSSLWNKNDWYEKSKNGVIIVGPHLFFNDNVIKNVYFALEIRGDFAVVTNNLIDNFGADAIRALSNNSKYIGNIIRDAYVEDYSKNHDDAIQIYDKDNLLNGFIENVEIKRNVIYTFRDNISQKMIEDHLVGYSMQGIIQTDGFGRNIVIENNLIVSDHYHGITLQGAENCRIQNNTVIKTPISQNPKTDVLPWIQCRKDKNGKVCKNTIIRNNIASKLTPWTFDEKDGMVSEKNLSPDFSIYQNYFVDYMNFDFHLKNNCPAIDFGVNKDLTEVDLDGNKRLIGTSVDCGAYEKQ
jgi:parallel beta-helix repeat protein